MTRDLQGKSSDHFTFDPTTTNLPVISASGQAGLYAYHGPKLRSGGTVKMSVLDSPTCVCDGGIKGTLDGVPFHKDCLPEPKGHLDMSRFHYSYHVFGCRRSPSAEEPK